MPHRVVVLALAPVVGFDAVIPSMVFGEAHDDGGDPLYDVRLCTLDGGSVAATTGFALTPHGGPELLDAADTVIVPGTQIDGPRYRGTLPAEVGAALARLRPGARRVSICTGAFVLAAAGVLHGRRATTHWSYAEDFRALYPSVDLDENVLYVDEGDVLSSAGLAAGIDLCLHLIRRDHGSAVATAAARHCVVPPWREGGQAQFIARPALDEGDESTAATRDWALARLDEHIDVARMAREARMSERTFNRRFRDETGRSPAAWLLSQRLDAARRLLETTDLTVDDIARRAGLGTGATLRTHLRAAVGVAPLTYRRTFRGTP